MKNELLNSREYSYLTWITEAIDQAIDLIETMSLGDLRKKVMEDKYFNTPKLNYYKLTSKYYLHVNTVRGWEKDFIDFISNFLGFTETSKDDILNITARRCKDDCLKQDDTEISQSCPDP